LNDFGFEGLDLSEGDFAAPGTIVQLGYEPIRVDIITSIPGVSFQQVWENRIIGQYGKEEVFFIGLNELIESKEQAGRTQDMADLEILREP